MTLAQKKEVESRFDELIQRVKTCSFEEYPEEREKLKSALFAELTRREEEIVVVAEGIKVIGITAEECKCCFARNKSISDLITKIKGDSLRV